MTMKTLRNLLVVCCCLAVSAGPITNADLSAKNKALLEANNPTNADNEVIQTDQDSDKTVVQILPAKVTSPVDITNQAEVLVDEFWRLLPKLHDYWVSSSDISKFLVRYALISTETLYLFNKEFTELGELTWTDDFEFLGCTKEFSRAYYRLLDVFTNPITRVLSIEDMDKIIGICEHFAGGSGGVLVESRFKDCFKKVIFRPAAISLIFEKYIWGLSGSIDGLFNMMMSKAQFAKIFTDIDLNNDLKLTEQETGAFWKDQSLGPSEDGMLLFRKLDFKQSGMITIDDWARLFDELDCDLNRNFLSFLEFLQLDLIQHDKRGYPNGTCMLERE